MPSENATAVCSNAADQHQASRCLSMWAEAIERGWEAAPPSGHRARRVRGVAPSSPVRSCVIAAPWFTVPTGGISPPVGRRPTGALCSGSAGRKAPGWWLRRPGLPSNSAVQHCKRQRLCLRRKSLAVCKCFSSLYSYFYGATKHVSEVCRSFEYKGFSVVPLNPLAMSSAFRWLCSLQWISLGLFEASRHVVMITRSSLMWECLLSFSLCQHGGRAPCQPSCNKGPAFHPKEGGGGRGRNLIAPLNIRL